MPGQVNLPTDYPSDRAWWATDAVELSRYANLSKGWEYSKGEIKRIKEHLATTKLPEGVRTLAVAGSLGRMEASESSDCDLVVVLDDALLKEEYPDQSMEDAAKKVAQGLYDQVWDALVPLKLERPKPTGTFSTPTSESQLSGKKNLGNSREGMGLMAKRQLLLLETQPVYRSDQYDKLVRAVLDCYAEKYVAPDSRKEWGFLINDLVRYFRSICVNYQWDFNNEHGKWPLRNVKLRHSRLVMYGGLLFLLGECSKERTDKYGWLLSRLKLTPLERIAHVYQGNGDTSFFRIAGFYDTFLGMLSRKEIRAELNGVDDESYPNRYTMAAYAALKANSDGLIAELLRFVFDRRGAWTERFFEYLIF